MKNFILFQIRRQLYFAHILTGCQMREFLLAVFFLLSICLPAQAGEQISHSWIGSLYNFEPHTFNSAQLTAKSRELDKFWDAAKADPSAALPVLRDALRQPAAPAFFYYDGSKLLLKLSTDRADEELALASMPKANLQGIQNTDYLVTMHAFGRDGFDVTTAALRVLDYPDFRAHIPQHALILDQKFSVLYILFTQPEEKWLARLIERSATEKDPVAIESTMHALWYAVTPASHAALRKLAMAPGTPERSKKFAESLLKRRGGSSLLPTSESALRAERMDIMRRPISDESLHELNAVTGKLLSKLNKQLAEAK